MQNDLSRILRKELYNKNNKVFLCIGTNKCIGDSLGPRIGEILNEKLYKNNIYVIGNLRENINYSNIFNTLNKIYNNIDNPYLILIDSALSNKEYVGNIVINKKGMIIGESLKKEKRKIGDIAIKGIVGENKENNIKNFNILNNVEEEVIEKLSNIISSQIISALKV